MAISDDLRLIAERADRELLEAYDFFHHSKLAWDAVKTLAAEGRQPDSTNVVTGTALHAAGLVALVPEYNRRYLATFTFRQFVSIFESFLFDFLQRLLLHNPWQFADKQLNFGTVLKAVNRDDIISDMILKQLNELRYDHLREWFAAINKSVKLECPTTDEIDTLAEIKATRDLLEHNAGVVNEVYRRKASGKARYSLGDTVEIDYQYHLDSWTLMRKVVAEVSSAAATRFAGA